MPLDFDGVKDALKELYPEQRIAELVFKNHPLMALMPARTDFFGRQFFVPIRHGKPQGRSHTFANSQIDEFGSLYEGFTIDRVNDYGNAQITGEAAEAAESEPARFIETLQAEMDGSLSTLGDNMALGSYTNTGGARAKIAAGGVTGDVITLDNPEDIVFFEVGMLITMDTDDGTTGGPAATPGSRILIVDEDAGTFTVNDIADMDTPTGGEFLFVVGDFGLDVAGLDAWLPAVAPTGGDSFFGVDRSVQPSRLAGIRFSAGSGTLIDGLINANARLRRSGGRISHFFANPIRVAQLELALEGRKIINDVPSPTFNGISFQALGVMLATGNVPVIADPDCPVDVVYGLQMDTWSRASLREAPRIFDGDGLRFLRIGNSDGFEIRTVARWNQYCNAPGHNIRIDVSSTTG